MRRCLALVTLLAAFGVAACGIDDPGPVADEDVPAREAEPDPDPAAEHQPEGSEDFDVTEFLTVEEFVDLAIENQIDLEEFCGGWQVAQDVGAEDLAYDGFRSTFEGVEGMEAREVFDELTSRC